MPYQYDPSAETFDPRECARAMCAAVEQLAADSGQSFESFTGRSLTEIAQLANATYDELPEFWKVWTSWHAPQPKPEMGDL